MTGALIEIEITYLMDRDFQISSFHLSNNLIHRADSQSALICKITSKSQILQSSKFRPNICRGIKFADKLRYHMG